MSRDLEDIAKLINDLPYDLRAEVALASLFNEEEFVDTLMISPKGQFKRPFRKDVLKANIVDFTFDDTEFINVEISRDGIYDILPEAIFHNPNTDAKKNSLELMTKEYARQQKEEREARKFFAPFENELYYAKINREKKELDYLLDLNGVKPFEFFYELWGIDKSIPVNLAAKFFKILPMTYSIVGDIEATQTCLSYLLDEPVQINVKPMITSVESNCGGVLNGARLGMDMVIGSQYQDYTIFYEILLGPFSNSSLIDYLYKGKRELFLTIFFDHFLPVEVEYKVKYLLREEEEEFCFDQEEQGILGMTTTI